MDEYKELYDKWMQKQSSFLYVAMLIVFLLEVFTFILSMVTNSLHRSILSHILIRIIFPAVMNFTLAVITSKVIKSTKISQHKKKYFIVTAMFVLAETIIYSHSYYTGVILTLFFPIVSSMLFADKKIIRYSLILVTFGGMLHFLIQYVDYQKYTVIYYIFNYIVMQVNILVAYECIESTLGVEREENSKVEKEYELEKELNTSLAVDELTGLRNFNYFKYELEARLKLEREKEENDKGLALAVIDIDGFRMINEKYGYKVGDKYLKIFGQILCDVIGSENVARIENEKFALMFTSKKIEEIFDNIKTIKRRINDSHYLNLVDSIVTFSCGIVEAKEDFNADKFYEDAYKAMKKSKEKGINQVIYVKKK